MKDENVIYNIMFDSIEDLGGFVEFEILYNDLEYEIAASYFSSMLKKK